MNPSNAKVIFESDPNNSPVEFKDYPREIDPTIDIPEPLEEKTHTFSRRNQKLARSLIRSYKHLKKYREYK
jgi:hypothetical protein